MGTVIASRDPDGIKTRCGFANGISLSSNGKFGGVDFWCKNIDIAILSHSKDNFVANVLDDHNQPRWEDMRIYRCLEMGNKHKIRGLKRDLREACP